MLIEIRCDKFKVEKIEFGPGLNVVLGDEVASNSIGKSTLLMILDFAFGGNTFLSYNADVTKELGHHCYYFVFEFSGKKHVFMRNTNSDNLVFKCNKDFQESDPIHLNDYTKLLKQLYGLDDLELSFRSIVSLYTRVWGKDNRDTKQPFHVNKNQRSAECIDNVIKLYNKYDVIKTLSRRVKELETEKQSIKKAFKQNLIPKITKTKHSSNVELIRNIDSEIDEIRSNLAKYAVNIRELVDREMSELKQLRDALTRERSTVQSRLKRVRNDVNGNRYVKSKSFSSLMDFFPEANATRFAEIEEFHSSITKILKAELKESESELSVHLKEIEDSIESIDASMQRAFSNVDNPSEIVDRVHGLAKKHSIATRENQYYRQDKDVSETLKELKTELKDKKTEISQVVSGTINTRIRELVNTVYDKTRQSPVLSMNETSYEFKAVEDTGTGKAYSSMILLDLAVLATTTLPFLVHDSILFKNIENTAVSNLVDKYVEFEKQTFIAIDEIHKYGEATAELLERRSAIKLSDSEQLFIKDWRKS